ncbi:LptF/LptG family permease [Sphingomonas sp. AX6]|uniref:LptF/LptG family permease n=1 Tax=Sphingomonas sp. AX6 TaxID=2653171 RepID=UPI0012F2D964|nr:LptF/LptG family permease [Sphingomonas sp. AX6]VXC80546.1 LPS export ABC transporter permease LptF [Sphingomonas sp. AX6]
MQSIDRYMARLIAVPLFSTLLIAAMLLVLDRMLRLFDFVATEGGPVGVVWRMLANLLPEYLGLGIPIGLLLGILLAFRKLSTSSELDVLRGVGMSYGRLLRVPFYYTIVLAALNLAIVGYVQPNARYNYEELRFELRSGALGASIKVGEFTSFGEAMTLRIEESEDDGASLTGIFVHVNTGEGSYLAATAETGQFLATDDPDVIIFRLTNGNLVHNSPSFTEPRVLSFTAHDLPIDLPRFENFRPRGGRDLERTLVELMEVSKNPQAPKEDRDASAANFHFRVVEVATMFLLPFLALALGVPPKRSTSALGVFLAIVMIVTIHKVNEYSESVAALGRVDPILALWGPFALFAGLVFWMFYQIAFVPGGQPIGAIDRVFGKLGKAIGRLLPGRKRKSA